jgi:hypothetical protein
MSYDQLYVDIVSAVRELGHLYGCGVITFLAYAFASQSSSSTVKFATASIAVGAIVAVLVSSDLGSHLECDDDPLRGACDRAVDFRPSRTENAKTFGVTFAVVTDSSLLGLWLSKNFKK